MNYILDSSVVLELFLGENDRDIDKIYNFIKTNFDSISVPELFFLEIYNVINKRFKSIEEREVIFNAVGEFSFSTINTPAFTIRNSAYSIAKNYNTTVYDASYHVMAIQTSAIFLTLDKKYYEKTKEIGNIELLSNLI